MRQCGCNGCMEQELETVWEEEEEEEEEGYEQDIAVTVVDESGARRRPQAVEEDLEESSL